MAELDWDNAVHAAHIGVTVTDGAVTLTGMVDSWPEKRAAVKAVKRVRGVHVIADEFDAGRVLCGDGTGTPASLTGALDSGRIFAVAVAQSRSGSIVVILSGAWF